MVERGDWLARIVADGRFANGAPGDGRLAVGAPADILVLDLDRLDRDAVMAVEPIDLLFARATAAHVDRLIVAGREVVRDGRLARVDLDAAEAALAAGISGRGSAPARPFSTRGRDSNRRRSRIIAAASAAAELRGPRR